MIVILPASKTLDFETPWTAKAVTQPIFLTEAEPLARELRALTPKALAARMALSEKLSAQVFEFYQRWHTPFTPKNARPALRAYAGDLYDGLEAATLTAADWRFAQDHLRILSGLYGLLRPLDLMQPYRLEMGGGVASGSLYAFWGDRITEALNRDLDLEREAARAPVLLNLASEEYAKALHRTKLRGAMVTPVFQEGMGGRFKVVSFHAKRARGRMARFIIRERLTEPAPLKRFSEDGYVFSQEASSSNLWIFRRETAGTSPAAKR
jgi:hypothetical protein